MISRNDKVHYSAGSIFFCWLSLGLVVWPILGDSFLFQNPREVCASRFLGGILGWMQTLPSKIWTWIANNLPIDPIYIYIYAVHSINKVIFLPENLGLEINSDESFQEAEHNQYDLLYWLQNPEFFLCWRVFSLRNVFSTQARLANPFFPIYKHFLLKHAFPYTSRILR